MTTLSWLWLPSKVATIPIRLSMFVNNHVKFQLFSIQKKRKLFYLMNAAILFHHGNETHLRIKYKQMVYSICDSYKLTFIVRLRNRTRWTQMAQISNLCRWTMILLWWLCTHTFMLVNSATGFFQIGIAVEYHNNKGLHLHTYTILLRQCIKFSELTPQSRNKSVTS